MKTEIVQEPARNAVRGELERLPYAVPQMEIVGLPTGTHMATSLEQVIDCYSTRNMGAAYQTLDSGLRGFGSRCEMGGLHDCGIDGWNSTDHGSRPVGAASAADFDPYGHKEIYPAESCRAVTAAFSEGAILGGWKNPVSQDRPFEGFGSDFGVRRGYVNDIMNIDGSDLLFRVRPDKPHRRADYEHLNLETIYNGGKRKPVIDNIHEPFEWRSGDE